MAYRVKHRKPGPKRETEYIMLDDIPQVAEYMAAYLDLDDVDDVERLIRESKAEGVGYYELYRRGNPTRRIQVNFTGLT